MAVNYDAPLFMNLLTLFRLARDKRFEDGMESRFSRDLNAIIEQYGDKALDMLGHIIVKDQGGVHPDVSGEALRWIGRHENPNGTRGMQRFLLTRALEHASPLVRDGAGLGLASLDDTTTIHQLKAAIERETNTQLKQNLEQVLEQLLETWRGM